MVVLAVDVGADRPADGDVAGAGETGTNQPSGSSTCISRCSETPASHTTRPLTASISWMRSRPVMSSTAPPAFCAASPYARPSPRAIVPRPPHSRTARTTSSYVPGRSTCAELGAVRPQPVTEVASAAGSAAKGTGISLTVSSGRYQKGVMPCFSP